MLIYAVEDEESIKDLYTYSIRNAGMDVICFEKGEELFTVLGSGVYPDLIILDIMLDGMDGYEILSKLKRSPKLEQIPVIMVSAKGEELSKVRGLDLGADDYLSKPFGVLELISRIKANTRNLKKPDIIEYKDIRIDGGAHSISIAGKELICTPKVYELIKLLILRAGTVINRDELLEKIWGGGYEGETRTLDMHISETRKHLNEYGSAIEIKTIHSVGYMLK